MTRARGSITDFLTDGGLAALCDAIGNLTGVGVSLHDADGRRIFTADASPPWTRRDTLDPLDRRVLNALRGGEEPGADLAVCPVAVPDGVIGAIAAHNDAGAPVPGLIRVITTRLAMTVGEFCAQELMLARRNAELDALFALSSLIVQATDLDELLDVALRAACERFGAPAGTIHLLSAEQGSLRLHAQRGLSEAFAERFASLPVERIADAEALRGSVHAVGDLIEEGRALLLEEIREEGLVSMASTGLVFRAEPLGIIRLYFREHRLIDPMDQALLQTIAEQVAAGLASARLLETQQRHRQVQRQMRLASDVQRRLLPATMPEHPRLDLGARTVPAFDLGGDFYDFWDLGGHVGLIIGDVVGKNVPAALLMASVRASLRAHALDLYDLDRVLELANRTLVRDTLDNEFATVFYGVIDPETGRLTYASAGHEPAILIRRAQRDAPRATVLDSEGMVLGIDAAQTYERSIAELQPGDTLLAVTDGTVEALDFQGARFGRPRLISAVTDYLAQHPDATAQQIADHIVWEVRRFAGLREQSDDITVIVARRR